MIGWTLVDLSHMASQYEQLGYVTNSMFLVCLFHTIYVIDLLYYEAWYLETIDIMHDRLGFNLTYGAIVWIPFGYTFQTWYLSYNPKDLSAPWFWTLFSLGLLGYVLFRDSNNQRRQFRASQGKMKIWGVQKKNKNNSNNNNSSASSFLNASVDEELASKCVVAKFTTVDGKQGESLLLTAGYWGLARHFNYLADLLQSFCYCAPCGFAHIVPWQYFIFMVWLLNHRANRDHRRCHQKYGVYWEEYCRRVPYKIVPFIY
jgi:7-dehydrocholesterol reductase